MIRVKTAEGKTLESQKIRFKYDEEFPEISLDQDNSLALDANDPFFDFIEVSGRVTSLYGVRALSYRIIPVGVTFKNGGVAAATLGEIPSELIPVKIENKGSFRFQIHKDSFAEGVHLIEIIAESAGGNKSATAIAVNKFPVSDGYTATSKSPAPVILWVDLLWACTAVIWIRIWRFSPARI